MLAAVVSGCSETEVLNRARLNVALISLVIAPTCAARCVHKTERLRRRRSYLTIESRCLAWDAQANAGIGTEFLAHREKTEMTRYDSVHETLSGAGGRGIARARGRFPHV